MSESFFGFNDDVHALVAHIHCGLSSLYSKSNLYRRVRCH